MIFKALKMDGLGNDFLIIDNRSQNINLKPEQIEFWLEIKNRIHERLNYKKENNNWVKEILYP